MIEKIIDIALKNRLLTIILIIGLMVTGVYKYNQLPTDAFPDISPVMVPIFAEAEGMAPQEVERLITFPIESSMNGLPSIKQIKSTSAFGMAVVYVYFEEDVDIYFARQIVAERLNSVKDDLPEMHEPPALGPISTGLGEVFMYYLKLDHTADTEGKDPGTYLREINDWIVKYQLQAVKGVTEVLSMGGHVLQYQIKVDPYALQKYDVGIEEIIEAVNNNNTNVGGQFIVTGAEEYLVRGVGLLENLSDIEKIKIKTVAGKPVFLDQIADIDYGNEIRRGAVVLNGKEDIVSGIVMKLIGENTSVVLEHLKNKIPELQKSLPKGVSFIPHYDQGALIDKATGTIEKALIQGSFLVLLTLLFFLGNIRAALIVVLALPVCALISVIGMDLKGLSANLMSLGGIAIAIGMLADGAIVTVENIFRHLSDPLNQTKNKFSVVYNATVEVARPIVFSLTIVVIVFLPIFTLEGVEGKMFGPMALTLTYAIIGAIFFAIIAAPVLSYYFLKGGSGKEFFLMTWLKRGYRHVLLFTLKHKITVTIMTVAAFIGSLFVVPHLGTEFMPTLEEGTMIVGLVASPSTSLEQTIKTVMKVEKQLLKYDEILETVSKTGRPEAGSHPHPVNSSMIQLTLKPLDEWKDYETKEELIAAINHDLSDYPGISLNFSQPIQHAFDDLLSGVKTQFAMKLYGEDLTELKNTAEEIKNVIKDVPGLVDLATEQSFGQPQLEINVDRENCARYGVNASEIMEVIEMAIGGSNIDQIYINNRRFGIHLRYQEQYRDNPDAIKKILVHRDNGTKIPLSYVADVDLKIGPLQINREKNQRRWAITANIRGRDMGSVVKDIKQIVADKVVLPTGYFLEYGGQFKNQIRAMNRLSYIVPIAIFMIFVMLYMAFKSVKTAFLIILSIPLSLIGGVFGLYIMGEYLSVPASVGFIALFGIAVQDAMVLVTCIQQQRDDGMELTDAIVTGAMLRLRPVLVTSVTTFLGLLPLLMTHGVGAEIQKPLAIVVIFGLVSSTLLTLIIKPALFGLFEGKEHLPLDK